MPMTIFVHAVWLLAGGHGECADGCLPVRYAVMVSGVDDAGENVRQVQFRDCGADRAKAIGLFEHLSDVLDDGDVYGFTAKLTTDGEWVAVL